MSKKSDFVMAAQFKGFNREDLWPKPDIKAFVKALNEDEEFAQAFRAAVLEAAAEEVSEEDKATFGLAQLFGVDQP